MIDVTQGYEDTMSTPSREWNARLTFTKGEDTLTLTSADILAGSLKVTEKVMASDELTVGGTVSATFEVNILSTSVPGTFQLYGSSCFVEYGLKVSESYEYIPMGFFDIDEPTTGVTITSVKGFDRIMRTEKPYDTELIYPATLGEIYADICTKCYIPTDVVTFTNSDLIVDTKPLNQSYRTVLGMVTQLAGSFSRMGRDGKLYLKWFEDTDRLFHPSDRIKFESRKELIQITGVIYKDDSLETPTEYLAGAKTYPIDVSRNMLLDKTHQYVLNNILAKVNPIIMYPCSGEWVGCPEVEVGDVVRNVDIDNVEHPTPITSLTHVFGGNSSFEANARSGMVQQIIPFTEQIVAKLYRRVIQIVGEEIPDKLQDMVDKIQGVTGGSVVTVNHGDGKPIGHIYMDTDDVNTAQNYILINNEGIAFGNNGLLNPPTTAIGIDGQIISGTGFFDSLVTNLISSSLGERLDLSSNVAITSKVSQEDLENYVGGEVDTRITNYSSEVDQRFDNITTTFTEVTTEISDLGNELQTSLDEISTYIRFDINGIELGEIGNPIKLFVENDRIVFTQNDVEVAYIDNNKLYITDGEFLNSLRLGEFAFIPRSNGNLSFGKVM